MSSSSVTLLDRRSRAVSEEGSDDEQAHCPPRSAGLSLGESMARMHEVISSIATNLAVVVSQQQSVDSRLMSLDSRQSTMYEQVTGSVEHLAKRLSSMEKTISLILVSQHPDRCPPTIADQVAAAPATFDHPSALASSDTVICINCG